MQKPQKLRHLLEQYGAIGRLYCAPEGTGHCTAHVSIPEWCSVQPDQYNSHKQQQLSVSV